MKNDAYVLTFNNIVKEIGYTGIGGRDSARKISFWKQFFEDFSKIEAERRDESDDSENEGLIIGISPTLLIFGLD